MSRAHVALGLAVRELRAELNLSQEELAFEAGLHRTYIGGVERGERNVGYGNIIRLAEALRVRPSELIARAEKLTPKAKRR